MQFGRAQGAEDARESAVAPQCSDSPDRSGSPEGKLRSSPGARAASGHRNSGEYSLGKLEEAETRGLVGRLL